MPDPKSLGAISPCFIATDVPRSIRFYTESLGFDVRFSEPAEQPFFAIVGRDSVQVFLKSVEVPAQPNHTRHPWAPWDAFIYLEDPDTLAAEFATRGVAFYKELNDCSSGLRGFEIADPDGYILFFGCTKPEARR